MLLGVPILAAAIAVPVFGLSASGSPSLVHSKTFSLTASPALTSLSCLQATGKTAKATATVKRGSSNDALTLKLTGFKPHLGFDLFTVQNNTPPFGLAWYQSDIETNSSGNATVSIHTILLDQIFGFSSGPNPAAFAPANTFHVGFWFDTPAESAGCGGNQTPTPFNGEHSAGPLAFISQVNPSTGLGPLCTQPNGSGGCNP